MVLAALAARAATTGLGAPTRVAPEPAGAPADDGAAGGRHDSSGAGSSGTSGNMASSIQQAEVDFDSECVVCMLEEEEQRPWVVFTPCSHRIACKGCAEMLVERNMTCPKCRAPVEALLP